MSKRHRQVENEELELAFHRQKMLTARWYAKMSGSDTWKPGEREAYEAQSEALYRDIMRMIGEDAAKEFASLPEE